MLKAKGSANADIKASTELQYSPDFISASADTAFASTIEFPTNSFQQRTMCPIKRAPSGKMWGNTEMTTWGGPWTP